MKDEMTIRKIFHEFCLLAEIKSRNINQNKFFFLRDW